jgi:hypothetical protein
MSADKTGAKLMMMRPATIRRCQVSLHGIFLPGCMTTNFAAIANPLIRLDVRASRYGLQEHLDGLAALYTFKSQDTGMLHDSMTN